MRYYRNAAGGLSSLGADGVVSRYTAMRGWVIADDLAPQSLASMNWTPISAAEAVALARVINQLPRPV